MQELQTAIQNFGIYETDDITISDYDRYGLWGDQSLQLSTPKDFEYTNGNQKIYGRFFVQSNSEICNVLLRIYG